MFDFLIIGQGLAGSSLALELLQQGAKVYVIDSSSHTKASAVAGGIINPVTGKRLVKCWDWERTSQFAKQRYQDLDKLLLNDEKKIFSSKDVLRIYQNNKELEIISKRRKDPEYTSLISQIDNTAGDYNHDFYAPQGCFFIQGGGFVDLKLLIQETTRYLKLKNAYMEGTIEWKDLELTPQKITYKSIEAHHVILCQGSITESPGIYPLFKWLPFRHSKGEILFLKASLSKKLSDFIINFGHWILPLENNILKLGATFEWDNFTDGPTSEAQDTLLNSFKKTFLTQSDYKIIKHLVGARPCTSDNKPFLGTHPQHLNVSIFNGLGAKGALYAPYWAHRFSRFLLKKEPLDLEVSIERFLPQ